MSDTDAVELRDLRALLAVLRCESFTGAAEELGYTQSAISQQVAALEAELGQRLVERRPVRPTAAGRRLADHATRVLLRLDVARSELGRLGHGPSDVRVAACPLASPQLLAACLGALRASDPYVRVTLRSLDAASAVRAVASGAVDVALVDGIAGPNEPLHLVDAGLLASTALAETPLVVALSAEHPLACHARLSLDSLADAPWVSAPALVDQRAVERRRIAAWHESLRYEGGDLSTLLELVGAGLGAALLPAWCCRGDRVVVGIPLGEPRLVHRTELLTLRTAEASDNPVARELRARATLS
jgi:DNA-binding transcriptional LysR family regulator